MDLHLYTRELLDKHLLPDLKEIAQALGIIPEGNKTHRETWVAALVGQPFPVFQAIENSPGVDRAQDSIEPIEPETRTRARNLIPWDFNLPEEVYDPDIHGDIIDRSKSGTHCPGCGNFECENYPDGFILDGYRIVEKCIDCGNHFYESFYYQQLADVVTPVEPTETVAEKSLDVDRVQESIEEYFNIEDLWELDQPDCPACGGIYSLDADWSTEYAHGFWEIHCHKCDFTCSCSFEELPRCLRDEDEDEDEEDPPGADRAQESAEFPDLESALAEIARLRAQNDKLMELARSQSEEIRRAKDISPVEKPSLKRVLHLAQAACLDVLKNAEGDWILSMGHLKRSFKRLRDIWDLLISDDWYLMDLFSPPPPPLVAKPLFAPTHSKYSAIPFCDDGLIDTWSLRVNAELSGRSPPQEVIN